MENENIGTIAEEYKKFLVESQLQYEELIKKASEQFEALMKQAQTAAEQAPITTPQSVWVNGDDGARYLMLTEKAADSISTVLQQLEQFLPEIAKHFSGKNRQ